MQLKLTIIAIYVLLSIKPALGMDNSKIRSSSKVRGGSQTGNKFYDFETDNPERGLRTLQWSEDAPKWRGIFPGVNLVGVCFNRNCEARIRVVFSGLGYGDFYVIKNNIPKEDCLCPICERSVVPRTTAFSYCYYRVIFIKQNGDMGRIAWRKVEDECVVYDPTYNTDTYRTIKIECRRLDGIPPEDEDI